LLKLEKLDAGYGSKQILFGIDLEVRHGEIVVVVGPNGAGKTTLMTAISGLCLITAGRLLLDDADLATQRPDRIVARGISHCPEGRQIFQRLTVEENLLAAHLGRAKSFETLREEVFTHFPILRERRNGFAGRLSGGQQQMLAIARALMAEPILLLLDEPSLGLAPRVIVQIFRIVLDLVQSGIAILLVEQNVRLALELADYAYVLEGGRIRLDGRPDHIAAHSALAHLYLGGSVGG
jgi:branched-chain amino acid transport system ATP-binding protein